MNLKDLFGDGTKLKIYIQEQQPNQFQCYTQKMDFVNRMDQNVAKCWYPNEQMAVIQGCVGIVSFEISHHMFPKMTQNITRYNLNTDAFRTP